MKTKALLFFIASFIFTNVSAQQVLTSEFYSGNDSGWFKLVTIDMSATGGCCGHANIETEISYVNIGESYNVNATLRLRINKNSSQDEANWRYNVDGREGEVVKFKKINAYEYELWAYSPTAFGVFLAEFRVAMVGTFDITTYNTKTPVTDTGQEDVQLNGNWFVPNGNTHFSNLVQIGKSRYNVLSYNLNSTPTHGVKIKTNLKFANSSQMPTIFIEGYAYGKKRPIGLQLVWYIYNGRFISPTVSSFGGYTPKISIGEENGKVVLFIHDKEYYQRFSIRAFEKGRDADNETWYSGWSVVDEPFNGSNAKEFQYENKFAGNVTVKPLEGQEASLTVGGVVHSTEVKVSTDAASVPDYVFEEDYPLQDLSSLEQYLKVNKHLPEVPSASEMETEGIKVGEMEMLLLKKVEELTLHLIEQDKINKKIKDELKTTKIKNQVLESSYSNLLKRIEKLEKNR